MVQSGGGGRETGVAAPHQVGGKLGLPVPAEQALPAQIQRFAFISDVMSTFCPFPYLLPTTRRISCLVMKSVSTQGISPICALEYSTVPHISPYLPHQPALRPQGVEHGPVLGQQLRLHHSKQCCTKLV